MKTRKLASWWLNDVPVFFIRQTSLSNVPRRLGPNGSS
jgi:hypothetical protein